MTLRLLVFLMLSFFWSHVKGKEGAMPAPKLPIVLEDQGDTEASFKEMYGRPLHTASQKDAPFLVLILTSLGCPGCQKFMVKKYQQFVKKHGHDTDIHTIDFHLQKSDLTAMSVANLFPNQELRSFLFNNQEEWVGKGFDALTKILKKHNIVMTPAQRKQLINIRLEMLNQRQAIESIYDVDFLPFMMLLDRPRKRCIVIGSVESTEKILEQLRKKDYDVRESL